VGSTLIQFYVTLDLVDNNNIAVIIVWFTL